MRKFLLSLALLLGSAVLAFAQQGPLVQQSASRLDASTAVAVEFKTNAWLYRRLAHNAPLDPNSAAKSTLLLNSLIANQSTVYWNPVYPIYIVDGTTPTVRVIVGARNPDGTISQDPTQATLQPSFNAVPMPNPNTFVAQTGSDAESVIYQPTSHKLWEAWVWAKTGFRTTNSLGQQVDEWSIQWGGYEPDMRTNPGYWSNHQGAVAAGIPIPAFAITVQDIRQQAINHAVGISIPQSFNGNSFRFPAQRTDGQGVGDGTWLEYGMIFRLPADLDLNLYPKTAWDGVSPKQIWRLFAEAMQNYGMVLYDQGPVGIAIGEAGFTPQYASDPYSTDPIVATSAGGPVAAHHIADFPWDRVQLLAPITP